MLTVGEIKDYVKSNLELIEKKRDVKEAEVYASISSYSVMRICFSSNVICNALEEPKSDYEYGLSVRVLFKDGKIGFGKFDSGLSKKALLEAYEKAKRNRFIDKDFRSFPEPSIRNRFKKKSFSDRRIIKISDEKEIDLAYDLLHGALNTLERYETKDDFNITGEINFSFERMAVANSNGIFSYDESTGIYASLTTSVESKNVDFIGSSQGCSFKLRDVNLEEIGQESAEKAIPFNKSGKINSGFYNVVFSQSAFADLLYSRLSLSLSDLEFNSTPYYDDLNKKIGVDSLNISDDGNFPKGYFSRAFTDEGLVAGKTELIKEGILVDFISNDYYAKKFSHIKYFIPKNGFRGSYSSDIGINYTNLVVKEGDYSNEELLEKIRSGVYIGRIWYTYPLNGLTSADFTSTVRADSFIVENGRITKPLAPNTVRINDNLTNILRNIVGIGNSSKQIYSWGESNSVICPEIAAKNIRLDRIAFELR